MRKFAWSMVVMLVCGAVLAGIAGVIDAGAQDAAPAAGAVPADLAGKVNPVKPTAEGLAHAKKMWGFDCAVCHGATGDGKGELASSMKAPLKDYTDPASLSGMSDGELFYIIQKGKGEMPAEGGRAKDSDVWNLVSYVRSLGKK